MNLAFRVKGGGIVSFPFQTSTFLTRTVLAEKDPQKRIKILDDNLNHDIEDLEIRLSLREKIVTLMDNPNLELIEI